MSGYTIIDVDTHVTEVPDVWTSRASPLECAIPCRASTPTPRGGSGGF